LILEREHLGFSLHVGASNVVDYEICAHARFGDRSRGALEDLRGGWEECYGAL